MEELVPFVQQRYNHNGKVALLGHSSGGYGALRLAMDFPHLIHAISCQAGDMIFYWLLWGFDIIYWSHSKIWFAHELHTRFLEKSRYSHSEWAAMNILCMSAAYSPYSQQEIEIWKNNKDKKDIFPARIPVNFETGVIDFELFLSWEKHDPILMIDEQTNQKALSNYGQAFVDAGAYDEYHLHLGARRFVHKLRDYNIDHEYEEFEGGHRGTSYRFDTTIPKMIRACL